MFDALPTLVPMPPGVRLSYTELREITGTPQQRRMIEWFRDNGFTFKVDLNGYPVVARSHWDAVMGGAKPARPKTKPNRPQKVLH